MHDMQVSSFVKLNKPLCFLNQNLSSYQYLFGRLKDIPADFVVLLALVKGYIQLPVHNKGSPPDIEHEESHP